PRPLAACAGLGYAVRSAAARLSPSRRIAAACGAAVRWVADGAARLGRALLVARGTRLAAQHEPRLAAGRPRRTAHDLASTARVQGGRSLRLPRSAADVRPVVGARRAVPIRAAVGPPVAH